MNARFLGAKEILFIIFPIITAVFISILITGYFKNFLLSGVINDRLSSPRAISTGDIFEYVKTPFISRELFENIIDIRPYAETIKEYPESQTEIQQNPPDYTVSFIYIGRNKYAIINGKLYSEGEILPSDEKIIRITKRGVLLKGKWGDRWLRFLGF